MKKSYAMFLTIHVEFNKRCKSFSKIAFLFVYTGYHNPNIYRENITEQYCFSFNFPTHIKHHSQHNI